MVSGIPRTDTLAHVMKTCKETSSSEDAFIRSVEAAPEPMCVQQLIDLQRFCTESPSSVLSIDPTFNLGPFYVTPTTYHNLLVETDKGNHPIVLGPILIHQTKTFQPFHYFASTLIRLNPQLTELKAFGTDGEPELIKAFHVCFPKAVHLRCTNHLRQNVKDKLRSLGVPQSVFSEFLSDVFGVQKGSNFEAGLVDADSEASFSTALDNLKHRWNNLERSCHGSDPQFHSWFCKYKASDIIKCVLPGVRVKAGVSPTHRFTTNVSESINHVIKQEVDWKENKLPVLIDHLKAITKQHVAELEKAVIGRGEWKFTTMHKHLQIPGTTWFSKNLEFKEKHMKKVQSCKVTKKAVGASCSPESASGSSFVSTLSVPVEKSGVTAIAPSTLNNIWKKAEVLVASEGHIINAPWLSDEKARLVKSSSSPHPHIVKTHKKNNKLYCCDDNCIMFKGFLLCAHVVAVAENNGDLKAFLDTVNGTCGPNLTAIANQGLLNGAGRKGGVPKRKRKSTVPIQSKSVRPCFELNTPQPSPSQCNSGVAPPSSASVLCQGSPTTSSCLKSSLSEVPGPSVLVSDQDLLHQFMSSLPVATTCYLPSPSLPTTSVSQATSHGQVVVGTGVSFNIASPVLQSSPVLPIPGGTSAFSPREPSSSKPFTLKFKTKQIRVCQSCRNNYEGENDTLGLVVTHPEKRLISNTITGAQFLGKESNSHYHAHIKCLRIADSSFTGDHLVIPEDVLVKLTIFQKVYLTTCLEVPAEKVNFM